jgi:hypothetical protein
MEQVLTSPTDPGPIPKIRIGRPDTVTLHNFHECVEIAGHSSWGWTALREFLEWLAFGTGVIGDPPKLTDKVQENLYRTFNGELWLRHPYDYIGKYICEQRGKGWNPNAFYPTPHEVIECMNAIVMHDIESAGEDSRLKKVNDCCMGTGRMLIHAGNHCLRLSGADIDWLMVLSTKVNGAFYVPWMVVPVGDELPWGVAVEEELPLATFVDFTW